jgi:hypothetical protein
MNPCKSGAAQSGANNHNARNNNLRQNHNNKKAQKNLQGGGLKLALTATSPQPHSTKQQQQMASAPSLAMTNKKKNKNRRRGQGKKNALAVASLSLAVNKPHSGLPMLTLPHLLLFLQSRLLSMVLYILHTMRKHHAKAHTISVFAILALHVAPITLNIPIWRNIYGLLLIRTLMALCPQTSKSTTCVKIRWESHHDYSRSWDLV